MMIEKLLAGGVLVLCAVMLLRLCLGHRLQRRLDEFGRTLVRWPSRLVQRSRASRQAAEAIRRAKGDGDWKGNVYTPKSFRRPRKPH